MTIAMATQPPQIPEWGKKLEGWNATVWRTATGSPMMRSAMTSLMILDRTPDIDALRDRMERVSRWFPALRQRVVEPIGPLGQPRMIVDPEFDISFHASHYALPAPASYEQLLRHARRQMLQDLDRDRPLWRAVIIDGLPGGRCAIIHVIHHAIADGQGAVMIVAGMLDFAADAPPPTDPMPPAPKPGRVDRPTVTAVAWGSAAKRAGTTYAGLLKAWPKAWFDLATHPQKTTTDAARMALSAARTFTSPTAGLSKLMTGRGSTYTPRTLDVAFADLRAAAKNYHGTINDAFLTAVTGGVRRYHRVHRAEITKLRVSVPVSFRTADDKAEENRVGVARVDLEAAEPDVASRFADAHAAVERARNEPFLRHPDVLGDVSRLFPVDVVVKLTTGLDLTASNVPGIPVPVWIGGAKLERSYPLVPTIGAAANITMVSYAKQRCCIGVNTDDVASPDPDVFIHCLAEGFDEIGVPIGKHAFDPFAQLASSD